MAGILCRLIRRTITKVFWQGGEVFGNDICLLAGQCVVGAWILFPPIPPAPRGGEIRRAEGPDSKISHVGGDGISFFPKIVAEDPVCHFAICESASFPVKKIVILAVDTPKVRIRFRPVRKPCASIRVKGLKFRRLHRFAGGQSQGNQRKPQ